MPKTLVTGWLNNFSLDQTNHTQVYSSHTGHMAKSSIEFNCTILVDDMDYNSFGKTHNAKIALVDMESGDDFITVDQISKMCSHGSNSLMLALSSDNDNERKVAEIILSITTLSTSCIPPLGRLN
jgi:hypothetical protein